MTSRRLLASGVLVLVIAGVVVWSLSRHAHHSHESSVSRPAKKSQSAAGEKLPSAGARDCFVRAEACGYPGPNDTGVANCGALAPDGGTTIGNAGERVEGKDFNGEVIVDAPNVTMKDDCVQVNGGEAVSSSAVLIQSGASGFKIENSTVRGLNERSESIEVAINNISNAEPGFTAVGDRIENCGTCLYYAGSLENSYVDNNGLLGLDEKAVNHAEPWYFSNGTITANHDTIYNPAKQAAVIFAAVANGTKCNDHETVANSLLGGGGYVFYFCAHSSGNEGSTIDIKDNRFARLVCTKHEYEYDNGYECEGGRKSYYDAGEGRGGYFPRGGFFGVVAEGEGLYDRGVGWRGNYWDDNLEAQPEQALCPKCG
jgi:hypothetical protein